MYEFYYTDSSDIRFYPIVKSFTIVRERDEENPFIIRTIVNAILSVTDSDFTFFESYKGTSNEILGKFKETVNSNTKTYDCVFLINENIDYTTNFLDVSMFIRDEYFNLLENPLKNIETDYDLKQVLAGKNIGVEKINEDTSSTFSLGNYNFRDILEYIINDLDPSININTSTYSIFDSNNYNYIVISSLDDYSRQSARVLTEVTLINLKYILDFLSFNSGLQFYYYLDSSNNLVFDNIQNLTSGSFILDLTSYNSINWCNQKLDILKNEQKFSLIKYSNIYNSELFKDLRCVFPKNAKNENLVEYNFIVDLDQFDSVDTRNDKATSGFLIANCYSASVNLQTEAWNNSGTIPLDTFTSNATGTSLSGSNSSGGYQYAERDIFPAQAGQVLNLSWNYVIPQTGRLVEIWEFGGVQVASFNMNDGSGSYVVEGTGNYYFRVSLSNSSTSFDITNFLITLDNLIVRDSTVSSTYVNNYEFSPTYAIENHGGLFPDPTGIFNGATETGLNVKPSQVEEIEFPFDDILDNFDFSKYVKTNISTQMIPYRIERTILNLDEKGFDKLTLKKV